MKEPLFRSEFGSFNYVTEAGVVIAVAATELEAERITAALNRLEPEDLERRVLELDAAICATVGETGEREKRRALLRRALGDRA